MASGMNRVASRFSTDKDLTATGGGTTSNAHMSRFFLALRCFLAVLTRRDLPKEVVALLPPAPPAPAAAKPVEPEPVQAAKPAPAASEPPPVTADAKLSDGERLAACHRGAVQLLGVLQREGRLLDFLMEEIDSYGDAQIGAAVRDIHRGCRKALNEHIKLRPIRTEADESVVRIQPGYDPSQIRLIGRVSGRPPFEGTLRHHGWRSGDINLSDIPSGHDPSVVCAAEVEIGA